VLGHAVVVVAISVWRDSCRSSPVEGRHSAVEGLVVATDSARHSWPLVGTDAALGKVVETGEEGAVEAGSIGRVEAAGADSVYFARMASVALAEVQGRETTDPGRERQ
jgi:hypothetical protein